MISFLVLSASLLLVETTEHEPVFAEKPPVFQSKEVELTEYQKAYRQVELGGTATVTINGVPYFCWNQNGTPVMQPVCVSGQCGASSIRYRIYP